MQDMEDIGWVPAGFLAVFILVLAIIIWQNRRRRRGWTQVATEFGLSYDRGDPLALSRRLGAEVSETIWGRFEGADVAIVNATRRVSVLENPERWSTSSVGVSLRIGVTQGLEVANEAAGPNMRAGLTPDGLLIVSPRGRRLHRVMHHRTSAQNLPDLLQATARATKSQYW